MNEQENKIKTWITLTYEGDGLPIAYHLKQEGKESIVGLVDDRSELGLEGKEDEEEKKKRLQSHDGMVKKFPTSKLVKALKKVKNKDEYFIYCDSNNEWKFAQELVKAGFKNGIFPTEEDFKMEEGREAAMDFVEEHYSDVQIIPHVKVKTVEEAKKIVEESDVPLVVQSEGDHVSTIVGPDDVEQSRGVILASLEKHAKDYAKGEILLKEKLIAPIEITPQIVFWNGEPVFTDVDIETKNIGDGQNNGNQVGCGTNLIIRTDLDDEINRIAFPPIVYEIAKKHTGMFVWDISLYFTENGIFFGEFCSNRPGYDAIFTEMTMSHGPSEYFVKIMAGENPLEHFRYGTAVRVFNLKNSEDQEIIMENWKPIWLYEGKDKEGKILTIGYNWNLGVVTGRGNSILEAVENVYNNCNHLIFKEKYSRTKEDFLGDYPTSIMRRFNEINGLYIKTNE